MTLTLWVDWDVHLGEVTWIQVVSLRLTSSSGVWNRVVVGSDTVPEALHVLESHVLSLARSDWIFQARFQTSGVAERAEV